MDYIQRYNLFVAPFVFGVGLWNMNYFLMGMGVLNWSIGCLSGIKVRVK